MPPTDVIPEAADFKPTLWTVATVSDGGGAAKLEEAEDAGDGDDAEGGDGGAAAENACPAVPLSKNAQKRAAKFEVWEQRKVAKKAQEKEQKAAKGEEVRAAHKLKMDAMTAEERATYEEERAGVRAQRMQNGEEAKAKKKAALSASQGVILDLEFGHLMQEKEMRSMAKQLTFCYSANSKAQVPVRMYLTGLVGQMGEIARKACSGIDNWAVVSSDASYIETLAERKKHLVYLTADSEHELRDFDAEDIYIIGGIVDRNRYKNLTLDKANEQGIRHARLPIQNHLKMTGTHILTVNQTLDIIHAQLELRDWEKALERVVPLRKRKAGVAVEEAPAEKK